VTLTVGLLGTAPDGGTVGQVCTGVASTQVTETVRCEIGQGICAPGFTQCTTGAGPCGGLNCVNLQTDSNNCGGCGNVCPAGQTCMGGTCDLHVTLCPGAPCGANQVKCDGTTSGVCTAEEQIIVNKDIAAGRFTGTQLNKTGTNRSCYECLASAGCIDTNTTHGVECGDLTGTLTAGASAGETLSNACLDVINCIEGSAFTPGQQFPATTPPLAGTCADDLNNGVANCFCGPGVGATTFPGPNDDSSVCNMAPASQDNGACLAQELAGFGASSSTPVMTILGEYTDPTTASGMANELFACAGANSTPNCPQCF
jgi:hypothetical protein